MILGFNAQFVSLVLDGSKRQTIRAGSRWKAGMRADLYTGAYRPGERRLLFRATVTRVERIKMEPTRDGWQIRVDGKALESAEKEQLFYLDGFRPEPYQWGFCLVEASRYFPEHFTGQVIHWDYEQRWGHR